MENKCVIRVWFGKADGGENVGHATLETPTEYLSLWPENTSKAVTKIGQLLEHRPGAHFSSTYQDDHEMEGRPPEYTCHLYSLNVFKTNIKIHEIKSKTTQWSTAGNTSIGNWSCGVSRSCSGAVYEALIAGDMKNLAPPGFTTNAMTSPHNIFTWARVAKKEELKKYPLTKDYDNSQRYEYNPHDEVATMAIVQQFHSKAPSGTGPVKK